MNKSTSFFSSKLYARLLAIALAAATSAPVLAASWYVSPNGNDANAGTSTAPLRLIQTALGRAAVGDTIFLQAGTYTGTGDVDLSVNKRVNIESVSGSSSTTINCAGSSVNNHSAIIYGSAGTSGSPCLLQGITFENGYGSAVSAGQGGQSTSNGGAISITTSAIAISSCSFTQNFADNDGGAIYVDSSSNVSVANTSFALNKSGNFAGAIYNLGTLTGQNCTFTSNSSNDFVGTLYNDGSAILTTCNIQSSQEINNGAVENQASLTLTGCVLSGNSSSAGIGALYNDNANLTAKGCLFSQNTGGAAGGGIYTIGSSSNTVVIENCIFANNTSTAGGALYINGPAELIGCTTISNSTTNSSGGALYVDSGGNAILTDDILWSDSAESTTNEIYSTGKVTATYSDIDLGYTGKGNINSSPIFIATGNYHIASTSPCLYTGISVGSLTTDYTGRLRHDPPCMGAYEGGSVWSVVASLTGPDLNKRILWSNLDGEAALWTITPNGTRTALAFGPYAGDTPVALAIGPDNHNYLGWELSSGEAIIWNISPNGTHTSRAFNPGTGWSLVSLSVGPDSYLHITWQNKPGVTLIWNVSTTGAITVQEYGPE
ncbi:MAG TPA: hypothetical protein VGL56_01930 [Fimbriimonadaceae bacterium]|jgi:predicted outer membrane repeat protein